MALLTLRTSRPPSEATRSRPNRMVGSCMLPLPEPIAVFGTDAAGVPVAASTDCSTVGDGAGVPVLPSTELSVVGEGEGDTDALGDTEGDSDALGDTEGDTDGLGDADSEGDGDGDSGGGVTPKQITKWLRPACCPPSLSGVIRSVSEVTAGTYLYTFAPSPALTITASTGGFASSNEKVFFSASDVISIEPFAFEYV